jgi:hypothetical protein
MGGTRSTRTDGNNSKRGSEKTSRTNSIGET